MVYRAIGILVSTATTISFSEFQENGGAWNFNLISHENYGDDELTKSIRAFINEHNLQYKVAMITLHFELPGKNIGGASVAAFSGLPVISDLSMLDLELGGNGEFYTTTKNKLGMPGYEISDTDKSICIALMGILRWREENNFLSSNTGASRDSIGGAVWMGSEA